MLSKSYLYSLSWFVQVRELANLIQRTSFFDDAVDHLHDGQTFTPIDRNDKKSGIGDFSTSNACVFTRNMKEREFKRENIMRERANIFDWLFPKSENDAND
ncbi:hypothetical protein NGRA_3266 [Nosema granulosis]|uniref:Uncharacterized protein n=1 Tax=Nosema granulosis TaxID=83296 RepID=A0A9P6KXU6_9MICR|nr:hypothetical protein NGRA_3266 [Nosema granulosis]